ncbi:hypothetical protein HPP92_009812 [Vanilla planifolia]|uniref:Uncharacterized protein n=1 Tax=Vanilla planifolia TaxID=51239 RepID=A0A835RG31_VANPL|nr:hypothetical protein HPP92_009812 [Vanilla planifolia]
MNGRTRSPSERGRCSRSRQEAGSGGREGEGRKRVGLRLEAMSASGRMRLRLTGVVTKVTGSRGWRGRRARSSMELGDLGPQQGIRRKWVRFGFVGSTCSSSSWNWELNVGGAID